MMGDTEKPSQPPLPGFFDDNTKKTEDDGIVYESFRDPNYQPPTNEKYHPPYDGPYQEELTPGIKGYRSETSKEAEEKVSRTVDLIQSWDLDKEAIPFIYQVAEGRGFDSVLRMNIKGERFNDQIKEVQLCEKIFADGNEQERVRYIPVGATYVGGGVGLLMLHQEVNLENNKLGNTFYITRYVVAQRVSGAPNNYVTVMKMEIQDRDLAQDEEVDVLTLHGSRHIPFKKDKVTGLVQTDPNTHLPIKDYKIIPRLHFKMPSKLHNNVREFVRTIKPNSDLLAESYDLIKKGRRVDSPY
ncbi:MAG TPA: hypothetical protein VJY47_00430 [Candidatus Dojkabacteria bacterium]|nr:hypothetical protein [Candidatus Dojkabacteria bacterium]